MSDYTDDKIERMTQEMTDEQVRAYVKGKIDTLKGLYEKTTQGKFSFSASLVSGEITSGRNTIMRCEVDDEHENPRFQTDLVFLTAMYSEFPMIVAYINALEAKVQS